MSQFLAPIHTWLFNKITVLETIEKNIVATLDTEELKNKHQNLLKEFGDFIPDEPLENLIDQSNIHGWLQERITIAERRQASLVRSLMDVSSHAVEGVNNIYEAAGRESAKSLGLTDVSPSDIYKGLSNVLLEGMPCDRVNKVVTEEEDKIVWLTTSCVHRQNWESAGVQVENYYHFREAFTKGYVEVLNANLTYTYSCADEQIHEIVKN